MVDEQSLRQHDLGQVLRVSSQLTIMCGEHPFVLSSFSGAKVVKAKNKNKVAPIGGSLVLSVLDT